MWWFFTVLLLLVLIIEAMEIRLLTDEVRELRDDLQQCCGAPLDHPCHKCITVIQERHP